MADHTFTVTLSPQGPYHKGDEVTLTITIDPPHSPFLGLSFMGSFLRKKSYLILKCKQFDLPGGEFEKGLAEEATQKVKIKGLNEGSLEYLLDVVASGHKHLDGKTWKGKHDFWPVNFVGCNTDKLGQPTITVHGFPKASFSADEPISPSLADGEYPIGKATVNLKLDVAPKDSVRRHPASLILSSSGSALDKEYKVSFDSGQNTANVEVTLNDTGDNFETLNIQENTKKIQNNILGDITIPSLLVVEQKDCQLKKVKVRYPKIIFSDSPFKKGVTEENGKNICKPGDEITFNFEFDYKTPKVAKAILTSSALKNDKEFSVQTDNNTTSITAKISSEASAGEHDITLSAKSGCIVGEPKLVKITVVPEAIIGFDDGENWIKPSGDYCITDKVDFKIKLNDPAFSTKVYGNLKVGSASPLDITFEEGTDTTVISDIELTTVNKKTEVEITAIQDISKKGENTKKTIVVNDKNMVSIKNPSDEGPFYKEDKVKIPLSLEFKPKQDVLTGQLKCDVLFDKTYDVKFSKDSQEAEVEVKIVKTVKKKGTVTLVIKDKFRLDESNKSIELNTESVFKVSFADPKPAPAVPFCEGDKTKFKVKLSTTAREAGTIGKLTCAGAFDDEDITFAKGEDEKEIEVTFKAVTEPKDMTATFKFDDDSYVNSESNFEYKFKLNPFPKVQFKKDDPVKDGGKERDGFYSFLAQDEATLNLILSDNPSQAGAKAKISHDGFETDYEVKFTKQGSKEVSVIFSNPSDKTDVILGIVSGCQLDAENNKFKAVVKDERFVSFSKESDWLTPPPPHYKNDKIKIKLALTGPPPDGDVKFKLKFDGSNPKLIVIPKSKWTEQKQTHTEEIVLAKPKTMGKSVLELIEEPDGNCSIGTRKEVNNKIGDQTKLSFKESSLSEKIFQGDKFKVIVGMNNPARAGNIALATIKVSEDGIFPKNTGVDNKEVYEVKFDEGTKEVEVEMETVKPEDKANYLTEDKKVTLTLDVIDGTNVNLVKLKTCGLTIKPFPRVRFKPNPIKDVETKTEKKPIYPFQITQKATLRIRLNDKKEKLPQSGAIVQLTAKAFGDKKYNIEFKENEDKEIQVEFVDVTDGDSEEISIEVIDSASLTPDKTTLRVKVSDCAVYFHDKWINPRKTTKYPSNDHHAVGDRIWIRCERKAKDPKNLIAGVCAKITSKTFGDVEVAKHWYGNTINPRTYDVIFKKDEEISEPVEVTPVKAGEVDKFSSVIKGGDCSRPAKGTGFRIPVSGATSTDDEVAKMGKVTLAAAGIYGLGDSFEKEIAVHHYRVLHFSPSHYSSKPAEYIIQSKAKFTIVLNVPARKNTIFRISCPAFAGIYKDKKKDGSYYPGIVFPKGKMTKTVEVEFAQNPKVENDPEDTKYEINLERVRGNISIFGEQKIETGDDRETIHKNIKAKNLLGFLEVKVITPYVSFDADNPISPTPDKTKSTSKWSMFKKKKEIPVLGVGSKITLKVVLSHEAPKGTKARLVSYAFQGKAYPIEFAEGETSKEVEVELKTADADNPMLFTLYGESFCIGYSEKSGIENPNQLQILILPDPAIQFPFPLLLEEQIKTEQVSSEALLHTEDNLDDKPVIESSERGEWIEPYNQAFVKGDSAKITVRLSQPAPKGGATAILKCKAFTKDKEFTLAAGEQEKIIDVSFSKAPKWQNLQVSLEGKEGCVTGLEFIRTIQVFKDRKVYFDKNQVMVPDGPFNYGEEAYGGPFVAGDSCSIKVRLHPPAPINGVEPKLSGPITEKTVSFLQGEKVKSVEVTFDKESPTSQIIKLQKDDNTVLGTKNTQKVLVNTPEVNFAETPVNKPDEVISGGKAWIDFELKTPAPVKGCSVQVMSPAFRSASGYILNFPCGQKEAGLDVAIKDGYEEETSEKVTISGPTNCKLGTKKEIDLTINTGPRIKFTQDRLTLFSETAEFDQDAEVALKVEPSQEPDEDLEVKIKSTAFSGKVYIVKLPKGKTTAVEQKVILSKGHPQTSKGEVQQQKIKLVTPEGWQADPTPDKKDVIEPNAHIIYVKVKTPSTDDTTEECPIKEAEKQLEIKKLIAEEEEKQEKEDGPDLEKPCNLEAMYLTVTHGKYLEDGEKRGPAKNGTFEVVRKSTLASVPEQALISTPSRVPILQVIGGREFGDPHLDDKENSYHFTNIQVEVRPSKKFCDQRFEYSDGTSKQHPIIEVRDRIKGKLGKAEALAARAAGRISGAKAAAEAKIDEIKTKVTKVTDPVKEAAKGTIEKVKGLADDKAEKMLDRMTDLFEPITEVKRKVTDKVMTKVGDSLGLEKEDGGEDDNSGDAEEDATEGTGELRSKRPWKERYEWWPIEPFPGNVRNKFPDPEDSEEGGDSSEESSADSSGDDSGGEGTEGVSEEFADKGGELSEAVPVFEFPVYQAYQIWHENAEIEADGEEDEGDSEDEKEEGTGLIRDLMSAVSFAQMKPRQYMIELKSCGVPEQISEPSENLKAIIEVYPSDEFCINYEFNANIPDVELGAKGTFYDPKKGFGKDAGLKEVEKEEEAAVEEDSEEAEEVIYCSLGWEEEEEEEEEEEKEEEKEEVSIELDENEDGVLLQVGEEDPIPSQLGGARVFYEATHKKLKEGTQPTSSPKEAGEAHNPTRVFHKFGEEGFEEGHEEEKKSLISQFLGYLGEKGVYELGTKTGTVASASIDFDAATAGKISATQDWFDKNVFGSPDVGLSFTRNGKTGPFYLSIIKGIGTTIEATRSIVAVFNGLSSNCNVTIGWGVECKVSFLEGNLSFYWGWKEHSDHRVFKWYSLDLDLELISVAARINVGVGVSASLVKFKAVLYGEITIAATLEAGFERQTPDTITPEWLDTWIGVVGAAALGANVILVHENVFTINAAIKTGFKLKFRICPGLIDRFGIEYMIYWMGITAEAKLKVVSFKEKVKVIKIIEGNPKELPWKRGAVPRKAAAAWWNIRKKINLTWSRAVYQHNRALQRLRIYQELQLSIIKDSKKKRTLKTEEIPLYCFDGEESKDGKVHWEDVKKKFDAQWDECKAAFNEEQSKVLSSILHRSYRLDKRLLYYVSKIEDSLNNKIIVRLKALDEIKKQIKEFNEKIAEKEDESDEGVGASEELMKELINISKKPELHIYERVGNRPLATLDYNFYYLKYYADKRAKW
jgi:hypothetical protein